MPAMSTSVSSLGANGVIADANMELNVAIFACAMCLEFCCDECFLQNLWASLVMSWTAGNSLWSNFNVAFLHNLFVFFLHQ